MAEFGIYTFAFNKENKTTGIKSIKCDADNIKSDFMIGEIRFDKDTYSNMSLEEACIKRIRDEFSTKSGLEHYTINDI